MKCGLCNYWGYDMVVFFVLELLYFMMWWFDEMCIVVC